ncbi:phosphoesterase [bacterium]|nr:phosphoesterase [bacterium]
MRAVGSRSLFLLITWAMISSIRGDETISSMAPVGRGQNESIMTPVNQAITPTGRLVELAGLRPQVLALCPDGKTLVTSGKTNELYVISPDSAQILDRVPMPGAKTGPNDPPQDPAEFDRRAQASFTGLVFSADSRRLYLANVEGSIKVFGVDNGAIKPLYSLSLPETNLPTRKKEIPSGLALSADGLTLWVCGNLSNRLIEIDTKTGATKRTWDVGVAPYDVKLVKDRLFVSNWGGRRPDENSLTGPAGLGTKVRVDGVRHIANEGSISVINAEKNLVEREIVLGLHSCAMAVAPDEKHLVVANAGSDTLSVIDLATLEVVETIWTKENASALFGAMPNALAFDATGKNLFVCNGGMNSLAIIEFSPGKSELEGMLPVGWFPGAIVHDQARNAVYVANTKGHSPGKPNKNTSKIEFNSHMYHGSVSLVAVPSKSELAAGTQQVLANNRASAIRAALQPARPNQPPRPIPQRTGEPSSFDHVVYLIKENRTYDQVFGQLPQGNGEPSLCIFGEKETPNQHRMVQEFVLLDNTYCSGILSADGHQWSDAGLVTEYLEKSFASFPRSYPDGMSDEDVDALAYSPTGFLWDNAVKHQKSLRVYGEFAITETSWKDPAQKKPIRFLDYYQDFVNGTGLINIKSRPAIESLRPYLCTTTVGWDMAIPDVFRAAEFIKELKEFEKSGKFPNLVIICLPNDHTSGTSPSFPTPAAQVADNDLAFGQIVDAISHSSFWKKTCIFAIEDDPQAGYDHVSGYRTTAYVISPYTQRGKTISTQYNQTSLLRSMELILGLPPMNLFVASATPMTDCFTDTMDETPFVAVPNQVPLDQMNPEPKAITHPLLRQYAEASAKLPLDQVDRCPEDLLNRILWHAQKGPDAPYPSWAVTITEDDDD